ncbi:MAG: hypothetical protein IT480_14100 [Gammaproteobacteria bacterium]|nr:hypothetical protein [Gammaproteobacteria bacterium]
MSPCIPAAFIARLGASALLAMLVAACASLASETPGSSGLAGHWVLDRVASGDFDAAVTHMLAEHQKKMRARRRRMEYAADGSERAPIDPQDALGFPAVPDEAPDRVRRRLAETLRPPARLTIGLDADTVSLEADGEPGRRYTPGQRVGRIDVEGAARQDAGWSGKVFVVRQSYVSGARREQRYAVQGGALIVTLEYRDPYSGELALRSVYRQP